MRRKPDDSGDGLLPRQGVLIVLEVQNPFGHFVLSGWKLAEDADFFTVGPFLGNVSTLPVSLLVPRRFVRRVIDEQTVNL